VAPESRNPTIPDSLTRSRLTTITRTTSPNGHATAKFVASRTLTLIPTEPKPELF
jgi:hypothetical protein